MPFSCILGILSHPGSSYVSFTESPAMDPFIRPLEHYHRRIDLINDYVEDGAHYMSMMSGDSIDACRTHIRESIKPGGTRALWIPRVHFLRRGANGDREEYTASFLDYLNRAYSNQEIMAPTMTTYLPSSKKESLLAVYIDGNLKKRSAAKKAMFQAEIDGLDALKETLDGQQSTFKIKNNALSGAHCSPFTPLWNKTAHSTLTSICRSATSYANANNEKFLYGNRHYYTPDIVKTNLTTIIRHSDLEKMEKAMNRWALRAPTVEETMGCIKRGSETYWRNPDQMDLIHQLVDKLSPIQRSAFVFSNDLYHLAQCNPDFVHTFLNELASKATQPIEDLAQADKYIKGMDDNLHAFVSILMAKELKGKDIKALRKRATEENDAQAMHDYGITAATTQHKLDLIDHYAEFIQSFWVTDNLPSSVFSVPAIIRRGVLTSDTDSTIFTVQSWVEWHHGEVNFSDEAIATANSLVFIASQLVRHILAMLCGNMGVEPKKVLQLQMKNEFYFPVFALTSRAKHYYAYRAAQEGLVFSKMKPEIKGVALRSSAISAQIVQLAHQTMFDIMDTIMRGDRVKLSMIVRRVATIEREVLDAVANGSFEYFRRTSIKEREAYKAENGGNFQHYELWQYAFAQKYGDAPEPPYQAVAASMITDRPKQFEKWLTEMEDQEIAGKIREWCKKNDKLFIGTFYMPMVNLIARGVPREVSSAVDTRSLVSQLMESFYLILEGLGVYARNKNITRLISDDPTIPSLPEGVLNKAA
jgi:hypothetical protein